MGLEGSLWFSDFEWSFFWELLSYPYTVYVLPLNRLFNHASAWQVIQLSLYDNPCIQVVSNALATSRKTAYVFSGLTFLNYSLMNSFRDQNFLNPDWLVGRNLFFSNIHTSLRLIIFLITFPRHEVVEKRLLLFAVLPGFQIGNITANFLLSGMYRLS